MDFFAVVKAIEAASLGNVNQLRENILKKKQKTSLPPIGGIHYPDHSLGGHGRLAPATDWRVLLPALARDGGDKARGPWRAFAVDFSKYGGKASELVGPWRRGVPARNRARFNPRSHGRRTSVRAPNRSMAPIDSLAPCGPDYAAGREPLS